ncbi:LIM and senescent cell antigen-like-containing domain protein 2 [Allomyces arbusculus]|nr:LIM and senescent cell antigen-like-containing domain protein 2 [Allomyces arbusculus]
MSRIVSNCAVCLGALLPGVPAKFALGKQYHETCFLCSHCHQPFPDGVFFDLDGKLLCEADFNDLVSDKCHACGLAIEGPCVNALDAKFHAACFKCHLCRETLKGAFLKFDAKPYCRPCHDKVVSDERTLIATSCQRCKKPIDGTPFIYRGAKYHAHHFNCSLCKLELTPQCKEHDGKLYCPEDYLRVTAPVCFACKKSIFGPSTTLLGKTFHPEHVRCAKCEDVFPDGVFYEWHGQPLCPLHYHEATGVRCGRCLQVVRGNIVDAHGKKWCEDHFLCTACDKSLAGKEFCDWDGRPLCTPCFGKLPLKVRKRLNEHRLQVEKRKRAAGK